jgi:plasmid maintenance system killer protein
MVILFIRDKVKKEFNDSKLLIKRYGQVMAKIIRRRLDDLEAADNLEVMRSLPGRCHELKGNRKGQLSMDLEHPYRLIFVPAHDPVPIKEDSGIDWKMVTSLQIVEVVDTHE